MLVRVQCPGGSIAFINPASVSCISTYRTNVNVFTCDSNEPHLQWICETIEDASVDAENLVKALNEAEALKDLMPLKQVPGYRPSGSGTFTADLPNGCQIEAACKFAEQFLHEPLAGETDSVRKSSVIWYKAWREVLKS